ncbi:hypothetical protein AM233_02795 [Bacillus sp. FJAT-22058]|nr:hypothetical protein AM233_02795 [Bacillus sp. FJAT-22058]
MNVLFHFSFRPMYWGHVRILINLLLVLKVRTFCFIFITLPYIFLEIWYNIILYTYKLGVMINMETKEKRFKTEIIVLISICLGFIIRMSSVIIADRNLFSMYNIDLLILFIAIIGLIIWLNKKKKRI